MAALPILTTKLHIPQTRSLVHRSRLNQRLDKALQSRLTLISAPAGFGKTSLLSSWLSQLDRAKLSIAWLGLDEADNDPSRFWQYFISALQTIHPEFGEATLAALNSPQPVPVELMLTPLVNEIAAYPEEVLLILDDYHWMSAASIHEGVAFLLAYLPPDTHLVIATREDLPFPLHRLRARRQLVELRADDLRFTQDETAIFLQQIAGLHLSIDQVTALETRTEGWIAGLQMAAISLQGQQDPQVFINTFSGSHRYIFDYLIAEIFEQQPEHIQKFLLQTCILERICADVSAGLSNMLSADAADQAQITLEYLEKINLYLLPLDNERKWYRYHSLFAEALQQRLERTQPDWMPVLHEKAARWFQREGHLSEAMTHALKAQDFELASDLVEESALTLLIRGEIFTLLGWLGQFPNVWLTQRPWLAVYLAWGLLLSGQHQQLMPLLQQIGNLGNRHPEISGHLVAIQAYMAAVQGQIDVAQGFADQALSLLTNEDAAIRSVVVFTMGGLHFMRGNFSQAAAAFERAAQEGEAAGNIHVSVPALCALGDMQVKNEQYELAQIILERALRLGTGNSGKPLPLAGAAYLGLAELTLAQGKLEATRKYLDIGLPLAELWGNPDNLVSGYLTLAQLEMACSNLDAADLAIQKAEDIADQHTLSPGMPENLTVTKRQLQTVKDGASSPVFQTQILIDPLSDRELEVLRLMSEGFSNQEIAEKLIIALGTVKAHSSSIYRKLDVRGRTQAVIRGQELGLL